MSNQYIFQRVEKKYQLDHRQYLEFRNAVCDRIHEDSYGLHTIHNIYYDTPDYELIRNSLEKPKYKEKFRVRAYGEVTKESQVFLEIKKKYKGVVYKRRISLPWEQAEAFLEEGILPRDDNQILREIEYFMSFHHPKPQVYLAYDRTAYVGNEDSDLRITIDRNIRSRYHNLDLSCDEECSILNPGMYLMEIKVPLAYPVWLADILCDLKIYPASFSKYGTVYANSVRNKGFRPWIEQAADTVLSEI